jgi:hypothetical protein
MIPSMIELEPPIPSAEELQSYADRERERIPYELLWLWNELMWREAWARAKEQPPPLLRAALPRLCRSSVR